MSAPVVIAVVSWNTREHLGRCLESLAPGARDASTDVWVIDNASSDGSAALVRERFPWAQLIANDVNAGFGPAVNQVARASQAPWIVPANADVVLRPGALAALLEAGERHPGAGILAPRLVLGDGSTQHSVHPFPTIPKTLAFNLGLANLLPGLGQRMGLVGFWDGGRSQPVDWAHGAFLLVRRAAWEQSGGFDEQQWMFAEDLDLCWRVSQAGWEVRFVAEAEVGHAGATATTKAWGDERVARSQASAYAWMLRRRGLLRTRAYATINVLGAGARWAAVLPAALLGRPRARSLQPIHAEYVRLHRRGLARRPLLERTR